MAAFLYAFIFIYKYTKHLSVLYWPGTHKRIHWAVKIVALKVIELLNLVSILSGNSIF